jgi:hypothetical protein
MIQKKDFSIILSNQQEIQLESNCGAISFGGVNMSQEFVENIILPPPVIPLHNLKKGTPIPVPPPVFPGSASSPVKNVIAPPDAPQMEKGTGKKKERRMELAGLEPGDPLSTIGLLKLGVTNTFSTVPKFIAKYWGIILTVFALWYFLQYFEVFKFSRNYPALTPLWVFINKFVLLLVFVTASYNNFVAKAVYAAIIIRVGLPLYGRIRSEGFSKVVNDFKSIGPGLKDSWAKTGAKAMALFVCFAGSGAFISNYLTRNNKIDKIAVSLVLALALMKALSDGPKSLPFMTGRVVMKDIFVMLLKPSPVRNHHIYVTVSGLALGFLCCLPLAFLANMSENLGYITGSIAMIVAVVLFFIKKNPVQDR